MITLQDCMMRAQTLGPEQSAPTEKRILHTNTADFEAHKSSLRGRTNGAALETERPVNFDNAVASYPSSLRSVKDTLLMGLILSYRLRQN
eukprot:3256964-Amphidinium_carterae.1